MRIEDPEWEAWKVQLYRVSLLRKWISFLPFYASCNFKILSVLQLWILNLTDCHLLQVCPHLASPADSPLLVYLLVLIRLWIVLRQGIKSELICIWNEVHVSFCSCQYHMSLLLHYMELKRTVELGNFYHVRRNSDGIFLEIARKKANVIRVFFCFLHKLIN